jgi:membrane fusion protein (multidrug efflux system)
MHLKTVISPLVAAVALTVTLCGCKEEEAAPAPKTPEVGVVTLHPQTFTLVSDLPGRTTAFRIAEVRPQVDGIILKRFFKEGSEVKAGDQLYQIDPSVYNATLSSAQASLASSKSLADRYQQLIKEQAVSRQEYDDALSTKLQAEATLKSAQINVRYTKVMAPISGRIGRSAVTEGALVSNGQTTAMATIQQLDPIYVDVTQSSSEILKLRRELANGQLQKTGENSAKVSLTLEDGSSYGQGGKLEFAEVSVDETTGSVTLRAVFPNPDHTLLPGMFVHAKLEVGTQKSAILAPQQGVTRDLKGSPTAMVVNAENKVELRELKTSRTDRTNWVIEDGLHDGDRLITEGLQYVKAGDTVKVSDAKNVKAPSKNTQASAAAKGE